MRFLRYRRLLLRMVGRWRIKTKMIVLTMFVNVTVILIVAGALISNNLTLLNSRLESRINTELDLMSQNIGAALLFRDRDAATEMLTTLAVDPAIIGAELYALGESDPIASYYRFQPEAMAAVMASHFAKGQREVIVDGEVQGRLDLLFTTQEVEREIRQLFFYAFAVLAIAILLSLLGAFGIHAVITNPVVALHRLSRDVARSRDYSLRSTVESRDELGELSREFNRMLEQIQERDTMLEQQVRQRTAELEKLAEEFRHRALHDALTGLPNRAFLSEYFSAAAAHAQRNGSKMLLMLLDLDNFKTINDSLGHNFGDELLKLIAGKLKNMLRGDDIIVRLGGDEFIVLVENIGTSSDYIQIARRLADELLNGIQGDTLIYDQRVRLTASIGGAFFPDHGTELVTLKRNADIAMYSSKNQGRNRFSLFETSMDHSTARRLIVQNDLRQALAENHLRVVFQPKMDAKENRVFGCEALVRWQHPEQGILSPDMFIPFAEENGMIRDIDYFVLAHACAQAYTWRDLQQPPLRVAVNLSPDHFTDHKIVYKIEEMLQAAQLAPDQLEIEITEAMLINDPDLALDILSEIRRLGVIISLDDFGIGYSSLNYLRMLPVDVVKLDRSFVKNILSDPHDARLVRGIVALAKGLELDMVAEGVETQEQMRQLLGMGCTLMQGYYYLKPCPAQEFERWLVARGTRNSQSPAANH